MDIEVFELIHHDTKLVISININQPLPLFHPIIHISSKYLREYIDFSLMIHLRSFYVFCLPQTCLRVVALSISPISF